MTKHIAVLFGGPSAEREVSLTSGAAVAKALRGLGYQVTEIDAGADLAERLHAAKPDAVFNALHGRFGEDGCVQGVLELLRIPYTHSGVLASAIAMDKPMAKKIFAAAGLRCAEGRVCTKEEVIAGDPMARPFVVKPSNEGSSVGVRIVREKDNFTFDAVNWPYGDEVLVEQYIPGREIQVAVLENEKDRNKWDQNEKEGPQALGAIEIVPKSGFYDYDAKYTDGLAQHIMPAPIPENAYAEVMELARRAHVALGCRGLTRSDFRYDDTPRSLEKNNGDGVFYLLETNTQPGMTPLSLSPEIAAHRGISFEQLVERLVQSARLGA